MGAVAFDYATESQRVEKALRDALGNDVVVKTSEGWHGRVHVKVVSPYFDGKDEREKQQVFYEILRDQLGEDSQAVSLALVYGMDDI